MKTFKTLILLLFALVQDTDSFSQKPVPIGLGWSQNSVNAVVFRRNSVVSHKGYQYVSYYNPKGFVMLAKRKLGTQEWNLVKTQYKGDTRDAHKSISLMVDGNGYLHLSWDHHGNTLRYCKSIAPESLKLGEIEPMVGGKENYVTYPEFYRLKSGDLLFLYRDGGSGNGNLVLNRYDIRKKEWSRVQDNLINGEGERNAYWQACIDSQGTFHLSWVWRESPNVSTNHDMCYARSADGGRTWLTSKNDIYTLPINQGSAELALKIPQNSTLMNTTSMDANDKGEPYICTFFIPENSSIPQYHLIYLRNGSWASTQISERTLPFSLSGSGSKKILMSRPQFVISDNRAKVIYRDAQDGNKVTILESTNRNFDIWEKSFLTDHSVSSWEPSYDTELWVKKKKLHLFVQNVGQGDGETLEAMPPQHVYIYEID